MAVEARVVYVETYGWEMTMEKQDVEHHQIRGFALMVIDGSEKYGDDRQVVRVVFRQVPGGRIEQGDVQIERVELAVWDRERAPVGIGQPLDQGEILRALRAGVTGHVQKTNKQWLDSRFIPPPK